MLIQDVKNSTRGNWALGMNTIIPVSSDAAVLGKEVATNSISFFQDSLDESELEKESLTLHFRWNGAKSILQKLHLDWTQQIGIYETKGNGVARKLFQKYASWFPLQRKFHSIESFEKNSFQYYWSHARNFVTDAENQKRIVSNASSNISAITTEDLSRTTLADMVCLSADHLARVFKKEKQAETLVKYITDKRIHAARKFAIRCTKRPKLLKWPLSQDMMSTLASREIFKRKRSLTRGLKASSRISKRLVQLN